MRKNHRAVAIGVAALTSLGLAGLGVAAVSAKGGDTSKSAAVAAACSNGTASMGILTQSGSRAQLAFGASGDGALGEWHITAEIAGVQIVDVYTGSVGTQWSVAQSFDLPKGRNSLDIVADNSVTGESCTAGFAVKV